MDSTELTFPSLPDNFLAPLTDFRPSMKYLSLTALPVLLLGMAAVRASASEAITVTVANPSGIARPSETIDIPWREIVARIPGALPDHLAVRDAAGKQLPTQYTNFHPDDRKGVYDDFLFQHDFAAKEKSAVFTLETTDTPVPPFPTNAFARYVPERLDDFAWENDRIAHRIYGPALGTPAAGKFQMVSSGVDVWSKRVRYPIVDRWYLKSHDNYHKDTGEGLDMYETGRTRGCGGTGVWDGTTLFVSANWKTWKVLANGPVRAVFELTYDSWDAGGLQVSETKRFTVDAGHNLDAVESTFTFTGKPEITVALGLGKHPQAATALTKNEGQGSLAVWEKYVEDGQLGCAVLLAPGVKAAFAEDNNNYLILAHVKSGEPLHYHAGAGWNRSGDFSTKDDWNDYVAALAKRLKDPVTLAYSDAVTRPTVGAQNTALDWSIAMANSEMGRLKDQLLAAKKDKGGARWDYTTGLYTDALILLSERTGKPEFEASAEKIIGSFIGPDGKIATYSPAKSKKKKDASSSPTPSPSPGPSPSPAGPKSKPQPDAPPFSLDAIQSGVATLRLYDLTGNDKYLAAVKILRSQLRKHPRVNEGGFWHKQGYPNQMWLDGLYMGEPFYAEYAAYFNEPRRTSTTSRNSSRSSPNTPTIPKTGLFYHGWDENKTQPWANPTTGTTPNFWSRAIGWYAMGLVDVLDSRCRPGTPRAASISSPCCKKSPPAS